jgi:hypothetical protein
VKLVALAPHPTTPSGHVRKLEAGASVGQKVLRVTFHLEADLNALRIASDAGLVRGKELWRHTCFEAFLRTREGPEYYEFNFSPSRAWDAHRFSSYREGGVMAEEPVTQINASRGNGVLWVDALVMLDRLPSVPARPFQLGLSAVVEEKGAISYWALRHAPGKPDFHHADAFALEL